MSATPPPVTTATTAPAVHGSIDLATVLTSPSSVVDRVESLTRGSHTASYIWFTANGNQFLGEEWRRVPSSTPERTPEQRPRDRPHDYSVDHALDRPLDHPDGPASSLWLLRDGSHILLCRSWYEKGSLHRLTGPAHQEWVYARGVRHRQREEWHRHGAPHRFTGPAIQVWQLWSERSYLVKREWWQQGKLHHPVFPAIQEWLLRHGHRLPRYVGWFQQGVPRRSMKGPYPNGYIIVGQHYRLTDDGTHVVAMTEYVNHLGVLTPKGRVVGMMYEKKARTE